MPFFDSLASIIDPTEEGTIFGLFDPGDISPMNIWEGTDPLHILGTPPVDNPAEELNARISREQYQDYLDRYAPFEEDHIRSLTSDDYIRRGVESATSNAERTNKQAQDISERDIGRYNINVTPEQQQALSRLRKLGFAKNISGSANRARDSYRDLQLEGLNTVVGYGRGLARGTTNLAGQAAGLTTVRQNANRQASAQNTQNVLGLAGTIAGFFSSKDYKEDIKPADKQKLHKDIMQLDIKEYDYKEDAPARGKGMIGPIRESVPERFKEGVDRVSGQNELHALIASHQMLVDKVRELEKKSHGLTKN